MTFVNIERPSNVVKAIQMYFKEMFLFGFLSNPDFIMQWIKTDPAILTAKFWLPTPTFILIFVGLRIS